MSQPRSFVAVLILGLAACTDLTAAPPQPVQITAPILHCVGNAGQTVLEFARLPGPAPAPNQCVAITDPTGVPVAPYQAPAPYPGLQFTSQRLTLAPGDQLGVAIVDCTTGSLVPQGAGVGYFVRTVTAPTCLGVARGMTWGRYGDSDPANGIVRVGCQPPGFSCDAYYGDTACTDALPVMCKAPVDPTPPPSVTPPNDQYWSGNAVDFTPPVAPATAGLTSLAAVNAYCAATFGVGWEVAEFHDGSGWNFLAYEVTPMPQSRVWLDINDQPSATCW